MEHTEIRKVVRIPSLSNYARKMELQQSSCGAENETSILQDGKGRSSGDESQQIHSCRKAIQHPLSQARECEGH